MIYFKFIRPSDPDFVQKTTKQPFARMFCPFLIDPIEKYCYVEIPEAMLPDFFDNYAGDIGSDWQVLKDMHEFPIGMENLVIGRQNKFKVIMPRKDIPS